MVAMVHAGVRSPVTLTPSRPDSSAMVGTIPATLRRRVVARAIDLMTLVPVVGVAMYEPLVLRTLTTPSSVSPVMVGLMTLLGLAPATTLFAAGWLFGAQGWTAGNAAMGIRQFQTNGAAPGWRGPVKYALVFCTGVATLGLVPLVASLRAVHEPRHRTWFEQALGLVTLDVTHGARPTPATLPSVVTPPAEVMPAPRRQDRLTSAPGTGAGNGARTTREVLAMCLDDGNVVTAAGPVVLGRFPGVRAERGEKTLTLRDTTRAVSKVHCRLTPAPDGVWVEDLHSTNGTLVLQQDGAVLHAVPGIPLLAQVGDRIQLGPRILRLGRLSRS